MQTKPKNVCAAHEKEILETRRMKCLKNYAAKWGKFLRKELKIWKRS